MKRLLHALVYLPVLVPWLVFATLFRLANHLIPNRGKYSRWYFLGIEAICHSTRHNNRRG